MSGFFIGVIGLLHPKGFSPLIKMLNGSHFYSAESQRPPFKKTEFSRSFFIAKNRDFVMLNLFQHLNYIVCYNEPMNKTCAVYIMTNYSETSLYIGVTSNLQRRIWEHKNKAVDGFTKKYNVNRLVYYELTDSIETAINREKQLKRWHRDWKINLIKEMNPEFRDLSLDWT